MWGAGCCSALEEPAEPVEPPHGFAKPQSVVSSGAPGDGRAGTLEGPGELELRSWWCWEPGEHVCIMIHLWLGSVPRNASMWNDWLQQAGVFVIYLG